MDRQQAELRAMQMLGEAKAAISRAGTGLMLQKQNSMQRQGLLRQAGDALNELERIKIEASLSLREIGTNSKELIWLRRMAAGGTYSVPAPRPRSTSCPDPFPR